MICWSAAVTLSLLLLLLLADDVFSCYYINRVCVYCNCVPGWYWAEPLGYCHDIMMMSSSRLHNRLVHYTPIVDQCQISFYVALFSSFWSLFTVCVYHICHMHRWCVVPEYYFSMFLMCSLLLFWHRLKSRKKTNNDEKYITEWDGLCRFHHPSTKGDKKPPKINRHILYTPNPGVVNRYTSNVTFKSLMDFRHYLSFILHTCWMDASN